LTGEPDRRYLKAGVAVMRHRVFVRALLSVTTLLLIVPMLSVSAQLRSPVADLDWLSGAWGGEKDGVYAEEHWMTPLGGTLVGMHRDVRGGRTISFEFLRIEERGGRAVYLASPRGAPATPFTAVEQAPRRVLFENLAHDFPQRIIYWRDGEALHARVEGLVRGTLESEEWQWRALTR
jgi:Domain of unknown function (DUF6265)